MTQNKTQGARMGGRLDMNYYGVAMQGSIGTTNTGLRYWDRGKRTYYKDQDQNFMYSTRLPIKALFKVNTEIDDQKNGNQDHTTTYLAEKQKNLNTFRHRSVTQSRNPQNLLLNELDKVHCENQEKLRASSIQPQSYRPYVQSSYQTSYDSVYTNYSQVSTQQEQQSQQLISPEKSHLPYIDRQHKRILNAIQTIQNPKNIFKYRKSHVLSKEKWQKTRSSTDYI